jgi:hypothetical protein
LLNQKGESRLIQLEEVLAEREVFYHKMHLHLDGLHPDLQKVVDAMNAN